jgi:hypothetical protein
MDAKGPFCIMDCCICMNSCTLASIHKTKCNHYFHKQCIMQWYLNSERFNCPICRRCLPIRQFKDIKFKIKTNLMYEDFINQIIQFSIEHKMSSFIIFKYMSLLQHNYNTLLSYHCTIEQFQILFFSFAVNNMSVPVKCRYYYSCYLLEFYIHLSIYLSFKLKK